MGCQLISGTRPPASTASSGSGSNGSSQEAYQWARSSERPSWPSSSRSPCRSRHTPEGTYAPTQRTVGSAAGSGQGAIGPPGSAQPASHSHTTATVPARRARARVRPAAGRPAVVG